MIEDRIKAIIIDKLGPTDTANITVNSDLREDLGCDSLDVVELIMEFEKEYNIDIPDDAVLSMNTVGEISKYIEKRLAERK